MRGSWRLLVVCALATPLLLLVAARSFPDAAFTIAMAVNATSLLITAAAMFVAARRGDVRLRRMRRWFGFALVATAAGSVVTAVHAAVVDHVPVLSPANLAPVVWVPCALAGLFSVPSEQHREGGRARAALDAVVVTAALVILFWMLFLAPVYFASEQSPLAKIVLLGYPTVEFLVGVAAFAVAAHARGDVRRVLHLMTAGLMLAAVADAGSAAAGATGARGFDWTYVVTQAGLAVLLCAALMPTATDLADERGRASAVMDGVLPHAPLVLAVLVAAYQSLSGVPLDAVVVTLGSLMIFGMVARQVLFAKHLATVAHRLSVEATRDSLTGLLNRRSCLAALDTCLAERGPGEVAVVLLDLDGFKEVNDTFGHAAGDVALNDFAARLLSTVADSAVVARLGGDEFGVLVVGDNAERRALRYAQTLIAVQRSSLGVVTVSVGASAGIAVSLPGDTTSTILRRADLAMYEAKRSGVSQAAVFADEMAARAERRHLLTQALSGAVARGELTLVYQPLFRLDDGAVGGAEALLRWHSPLHGQVPPAEFVPLAEESGLIGEIGAWVLQRAAAQLRQWSDAGLVLPRLAVNVSPCQLTGAFAAEAVAIVKRHGVPPSAIALEITESAMPDLTGNLCIRQLRAAGFTIAMDDFGAGFSSLAQLAVLPVDTLKFDRELIRGVATPSGRLVVEAVIALAGGLGLTTVAEGIETLAELEVVRQGGCALGQGYYLSRPMAAEQLGALLTRGKNVPAPRAAEPAHAPFDADAPAPR